ncbi:MAG: nucleoside hydrolase [Flaviflexus sp.]|nr:nucleoside hydrolase [Flaviflexus sp.]
MKRVILDCDPGHDDAIALFLAAGNPEIEVAAITTVGGNQSLDKVTRNALGLATLAGLDCPVAAGASRPLVAEPQTAGEIHGESGLDGVVLPSPAMSLDPRHGAQVIVDTIMSAEPGEITLVPTGPLTNIALALRLEPAIAERVAEVSLMGGGAREGNWSPVAEFNIVVDPEAADAVFSAPWPLTMVGLDATHQALLTGEVIDRIRALDTDISRFVVDLFDFFIKTNLTEQGFPDPPLHDPVALARVIDPSVTSCKRTPIHVELTGTHTRGMTVTELRPWIEEPASTSVALGLDADRLWDLIVDAIDRLGTR